MPRAKPSHTSQPHLTTPIKDPWDTEHEAFLQRNPNAIAHSDTIYTGVVHKGFDADTTAEGLVRRYPAFQETERHREFLVRNISERFIVPGEKDDYFTPEQLWEEDDRIQGKKQFSWDDGESSFDEEDDEPSHAASGREVEREPVMLASMPKEAVGEEQLESDEQLAELLGDPVGDEKVVGSVDGPSANQKPEDVGMTGDDLAELFGEEPELPAITVTTPENTESEAPGHAEHAEPTVEKGGDPGLPITLQIDDHRTTITRNFPDVQRILASLDLSPKATLTAITQSSVDGSLVLAVLGHVKVNESQLGNASEGSDPQHPIRVDDSDAGDHEIDTRQPSTEKAASGNEWNVVTQHPHRPTVAFLSGPQTYSALMAEIRWDPDTIVATTTSYNDGRVLLVLVGEQSDSKLSKHATYNQQTDPADRFDDFFSMMRRHKNIPVEHLELASRLQLTHKDMIDAGALAASTPARADVDSSDSEKEITVPTRAGRRTSDHIETLKQSSIATEKKLYLAREAKTLPPTRCASYSKERMRQILQRPTADYTYFSHVSSRQQRKLASQDKENRPPANAQSARNRHPQQQVSGFPATFGTDYTVSSPKAKPATTGKRRRTPSDDVEDDDDDDYAMRPQRKCKIAKTKGNTTGRGRGRPKVNAQLSSQTGRRRANKATTLAESGQSIAEVRARLARNKILKSGEGEGGGSASSQADVGATGGRQMGGGEPRVLEGNDSEESDEE